LPVPASGCRIFRKGAGLAMLVYGILLFIGVGMGNGNPLRPLQGLTMNVAAAGECEQQRQQQQKVAFERVASVDALDTKLRQAAANKQWVMLDFYADWCVSCQEMEAYTFTDPRVIEKLARFVVLQADVTQNTDADKALLKRFNLVGPPATLFFAPAGQERSEYRIVGYQDAETFIAHLPSAD
jgi:thiol:disulfide interchange protein DsbD